MRSEADRVRLVGSAVCIHCFSPAVLGELYFFRFQHLDALGKGNAVGHGPEVTKDLVRFYRETLEHQDFPREVKRHAGDFPAAIADVMLFHQEMPALIEVPQDSPSERDFFE